MDHSVWDVQVYISFKKLSYTEYPKHLPNNMATVWQLWKDSVCFKTSHVPYLF